MFRLVYTILFALCMPFVFLKLLWRGYKAPEYRERKLERFGFFKAPNIKHSIWVHAVSVGEVLAAEPIIREMQKRYPNKAIVVTSMTPTSSELIRKLFDDSVFHVYAPYDLPWLVNAFLRRVNPAFMIIMETELWPNTIHQTHLRGCPVVLANARLSERSAKGYRRLKPAVGWMLNELSLVICQHQNDARRFASLGIDEEKISVTGSVKYDLDIAETHLMKGKEHKQALGKHQKVWIAASTHEGEDARLLDIHAHIRKKFPDTLLILVPRHPERFESVYQLSKTKHFTTFKRSECEFIPAEAEVFVVDAMGELLDFYAVADIAFIGGSLVEVGGHNPIEPGALGLPIVMGPHVFNFEAICQQLISVGGLYLAENDQLLEEYLLSLMADKNKAKEVGGAALTEINASKGAVLRVVDALSPLLEKTHQR